MLARPAPRSRRLLKVSHMSRAPLLRAMRLAVSRQRARRAAPVIRITAGSPERRAWAAWEIASGATVLRAGRGGAAAGPGPSLQATSAGTISVATPPGGSVAAATAAAPAAGSDSTSRAERTQPDTTRAIPSTSELSGAS